MSNARDPGHPASTEPERLGPIVGARATAILDQFEVRVLDESDDPALVHAPCGRRLCDIEHSDTMAVLTAVVLDHSRRCTVGLATEPMRDAAIVPRSQSTPG